MEETTALDCSGLGITDITGLNTLTALQTLDLSGNPDLLCSDLDTLEADLPDTVITRPDPCNNGNIITSSTVQNLHNGAGQRVVKTVNGDASTAIHFIYDRQGRVIAEMDAATGAALREYIYVNGQQVALVDDSGTAEEAVYYVYNDHLGTPQKITDANQAEVWAADYEPFGQAEVTTEEIVYNVRFPGQYEDTESGLHYNYFRDYDPSLGRYVESDPIGLVGGIHTYAYGLNNPIIYFDPNGLDVWGFSVGVGGTTKSLKSGSVAVTLALDSNGSFSIVVTPETGRGRSSGGGAFFRGLYGGGDSTVNSLEGLGASYSMTEGKGKRLASISVTIPIDECGIGDRIIEAGVGYGSRDMTVTSGYGMSIYRSEALGNLGRKIGKNLYEWIH